MTPFRVLLISNARPSRCWYFANRLTHEVPGTTICGIVQRPLRSIPLIQQQIAKGGIRKPLASEGWLTKQGRILRSLLQKFIESILWFVHGCPIEQRKQGQFTQDRLAKECARAGWPLVITQDTNLSEVLNLIYQDSIDLVVFLGEFLSVPDLSIVPLKGSVRASYYGDHEPVGAPTGTRIRIEHLTGGSETPSIVASVSLRWQPYDGLLGFALKSDQIADDLLLQTAASIHSGKSPTTLQQWADRVLGPCLTQFQGLADQAPQRSPVSLHCRSKWKLALDTLLLCSPWILARNWYRRCRNRYPILILAHHLISDRPHRMGMPTEVFLRQILYLQKHYRIVSLSQAIDLLRSGEVRVPTVALTFDDGYSDNFLNLRAVANEAGIPATLFITTHLVETHQEFGHDLTNGMTGFLPLTWDQVQYWSMRGAEFGSHTRTHMDCGTPDVANLRSEIIGSKDDLEAQLGMPVDLFAFPYGQHENMCPEAMQLAASTYFHFVSSFGGEASSGSKHLQPHLLRKNFYSSQWELELELQSVFDLSSTIRRLFSRSKKMAPNKKSRVLSPLNRNASVSPGTEPNLVDRSAFQRAPEGTRYRSSLP